MTARMALLFLYTQEQLAELKQQISQKIMLLLQLSDFLAM